jgi:hypothetical protein
MYRRKYSAFAAILPKRKLKCGGKRKKKENACVAGRFLPIFLLFFSFFFSRSRMLENIMLLRKKGKKDALAVRDTALTDMCNT